MKNIEISADEDTKKIFIDSQLGDTQYIRQSLNLMDARMLLAMLEAAINQIEDK